MQTFEIELKPSRHYLYFLAFLSFTAIIAILQLELNVVMKMAMLMGAIIYTIICCQKISLKHAHSIKRLTYFPHDQTWELETTKRKLKCVITKESYVSTRLIILCFRKKNAKRRLPFFDTLSCVIFRDALSQEKFHSLLLKLKMKEFGKNL